MILAITGNGKGKTTSALGSALRASGWGKRVAIVFFDKGGSHYGEQNILDFLQQKIDVFRFGLERFNETKKQFRFENTESDKIEVKKGIDKILNLYNEKYFLIVCDEIITCLNSRLTSDKVLRNLLKKCPKNTHLMLTGRCAPDWLIKKADLVSDIKEIKHYFKKGENAIKGIDY